MLTPVVEKLQVKIKAKAAVTQFASSDIREKNVKSSASNLGEKTPFIIKTP